MEIWKDIEGYEGLYQVSNLGRVKSLGNGNSNASKEKILKPGKNRENYLLVVLNKNGERRTCSVHRLVANAFIPNPNNKPCVDHVNTIRVDNRVDNIRWCTYKENSNNELTRKHNSELKKGEKHPMYGKHRSEETRQKISESKGKKIICVETGEVFSSTYEVERQLGINQTNISRCCRGKQKIAKGLTFRYLDQVLYYTFDINQV